MIEHGNPSSPGPKLRVAVLMGGTSSEHDVSISSGLQVLAALDRSRYDVVPVHLQRDGRWLVGTQPPPPSLQAGENGGAPESASGAITTTPHGSAGLESLSSGGAVDVAFIALHGKGGEDGTIQGLLTLLGIPFTGSGVLASALAMDKVRAKDVFAAHGIPVARSAVVTRREVARDRAAVLARILREPGLPCVVKPVAGGSSVATHLVARAEDLAPALDDALGEDARALVEERLVGTEVTCAVLGGGPHEDPLALPVTEICPKSGAFFDYRAKYTKGESEDITPARIPEDLTRRVQELAVRAHEALGCEGMSRTDFILRDGVPHALETNTIPGLTPLSLLPQAAAAAGMSFAQLLDRVITSAMRRAGR
jgi:D-alanine-D-alanine ligase